MIISHCYKEKKQIFNAISLFPKGGRAWQCKTSFFYVNDSEKADLDVILIRSLLLVHSFYALMAW